MYTLYSVRVKPYCVVERGPYKRKGLDDKMRNPEIMICGKCVNTEIFLFIKDLQYLTYYIQYIHGKIKKEIFGTMPMFSG